MKTSWQKWTNSRRPAPQLRGIILLRSPKFKPPPRPRVRMQPTKPTLLQRLLPRLLFPRLLLPKLLLPRILPQLLLFPSFLLLLLPGLPQAPPQPQRPEVPCQTKSFCPCTEYRSSPRFPSPPQSPLLPPQRSRDSPFRTRRVPRLLLLPGFSRTSNQLSQILPQGARVSLQSPCPQITVLHLSHLKISLMTMMILT